MALTEGQLHHQGSLLILGGTVQFCKRCALVQVQCWYTNTLGRLKMPMHTFWYWQGIDYCIVTEMPCSTKKKENVKMVWYINTGKGKTRSGKYKTSVTYSANISILTWQSFVKHTRLYIIAEKIKKKWQSVVTYGAHQGPDGHTSLITGDGESSVDCRLFARLHHQEPAIYSFVNACRCEIFRSLRYYS